MYELDKKYGLTFAVPIIRGNVYELQPSGDWPRLENGV